MRKISGILTLMILALSACNYKTDNHSVQQNQNEEMKKQKIEKQPDDVTFEISYLFNADIKRVFEMWTNPESFSSWLGPDGAEMNFITSNVTEGGTSLWSMTTNDGMTKYGQINFKSIKPNTLLVYIQNFCDMDGNFSKAPFSDTYPDYLLTTVNFSNVEANKTRLTVNWEIHGEATDKEKQTFHQMKGIMKAGWTASFLKLEALLK